METRKKIAARIFLILLVLFAVPLFAEDSFPQKIEWKSNANALEYKVEVQNISTGKVQTITTDRTSTELSLPPDRYRYRVHAYDFLGKESSVSSWTNFEVFKAGKPKISGIEKSAQKGTDGSIGLSVEISDVNENSKFELVNESLNGTIGVSDKLKMKKSASETENVSHLDFKNVPPGKWRLRVTNPSGLSSLSDIITVEGDKAYSTDEIEKIRFELEENIRAELQKKFDEEKASEIEKAIAEHELAKIRAEEERIEAEKRAEEEERLRLEREEQLRLEMEEAEKRRLKEERKRNKKPTDFIIEGGLGVTLRFYDKEFKDGYDQSFAPSLNVRAMILPINRGSNKYGLELCYIGQKLTHETDFLNAELISNVFDAKIVWQHEIVKHLSFQVKAGGGACMLKKSIAYSSNYLSRNAPDDASYIYPVAAGNLSVFCNILKFIVLEAGADYTHVLTDSSSMGMVTPYACAGIKF